MGLEKPGAHCECTAPALINDKNNAEQCVIYHKIFDFQQNREMFLYIIFSNNFLTFIRITINCNISPKKGFGSFFLPSLEESYKFLSNVGAPTDSSVS